MGTKGSPGRAMIAEPSEHESAAFWRDGLLIRRGLADGDICTSLADIAEQHLAQQLAPVEYELDVQYPGAPDSIDAKGANTARRLLQAYSRHADFRRWASSDEIVATIAALFNASDICLSQCHHNCIMTKEPGYSSVTRWHQDNRYWSFDEENLISAWLALGTENMHNGCLRVIPGSHRLELPPGRFDAAQFLRTDLVENKSLIAESIPVEMTSGDVLFFHSRLLHAAGRNLTDQTKLSLVYTYHTTSNQPISDTRSARFPAVVLR
jgi:phytanoyl-CoA hydroxylase